jgi:hypothetical protein
MTMTAYGLLILLLVQYIKSVFTDRRLHRMELRLLKIELDQRVEQRRRGEGP